MNLTARHQKRRLQTPAHPCYCEIHRGGNCPRNEGHMLGTDGIGVYRLIGYPLVRVGPRITVDGYDPTTTIEEQPWSYRDWTGNKFWRGWRHGKSDRRREDKLAKQAHKNPNYQSKAFTVAAAEWIAAGAEVTSSGPVYKARVEDDPVD